MRTAQLQLVYTGSACQPLHLAITGVQDGDMPITIPLLVLGRRST